MMKRYPFHTAAKIMWAGTIPLFIVSLVVGFNYGLLAQLPVVIVMIGWGFWVRKFLSET